jgi:deazaflavin-dependent oxidoreductase (nitroreductase family)
MELRVPGKDMIMADLPDTSFNSNVIEEFRANGGKVGGPFENLTLLLLHTTGAKSGAQRINPVGYFEIDGKLIVVGSYAGADIDPAWVHNLRAHPRTQVEIGADTVDVEARELPPDERDAVWAQIAAVAPSFGAYQDKTDRVIPLFELVRI